MDHSLKILLLEDSDVDAELLVRHLKRENLDFSHERVWLRDDFISRVNEFQPDLIIADHSLPQFSGMEAFEIVRNQEKNIPFILITGSVSEKLLTQYMKDGIDDYILKDNLLRLPSAIENVVNRKRIERLHRELSQMNQKLESAYSDIKDSINYAKKIQYAMLPEMSILESIFPKSFVFFKPKDVLSGDFFWFDIKDDMFYVAVVDCTGHGVPGALLSMMGSNMLNETINILGVTQPAEILNSLNRQVRRVLKHEKTDMRDGMDIALCAINLQNHETTFAGANHPMFVVRNGELLEFKADKNAIGAEEDNYCPYGEQRIRLYKGDRVFLFSDGYSDQFSYLTDKKLTIKRLRKLLLDSAHMPIKQQEKVVVDFFEEWMGDTEQIDDVLLVGIEI